MNNLARSILIQYWEVKPNILNSASAIGNAADTICRKITVQPGEISDATILPQLYRLHRRQKGNGLVGIEPMEPQKGNSMGDRFIKLIIAMSAFVGTPGSAASITYSSQARGQSRCEEAAVIKAAASLGRKSEIGVRDDIALLRQFTDDLKDLARRSGMRPSAIHYIQARVRALLPIYCLGIPKIRPEKSPWILASQSKFSDSDEQKLKSILWKLNGKYPQRKYQSCSDCIISDIWKDKIYFYSTHSEALRNYSSSDDSPGIKASFKRLHHDVTLQTIWMVIHTL